MSMEPISESIYELLVRQGIGAGKPASKLATKGAERSANPKARRMKERGAVSDGARSRVKADARGMEHQPTGGAGGVRGPIYLAWVNTAMRQGTGRKRVPFLMIVK